MGDLIKLKNKSRFQIKAKSATRAEILLYGEIGESWWSDSITAKEVKEKINELDDTVNQIDVRINSPGGDVFEGISMYNILKSHKANVTVYVDGLAASIASIIMLAGDEVVFGTGALMMIHKPWTCACGDAQALETVIDRLNDVENQMINIYRKKTNMDRAELKGFLAAETWWDADQAIEHGFCDRKMDEDDNIVDMAASLENARWINKKPNLQNKKDLVKSKLSDFTKDIEGFLAR